MFKHHLSQLVEEKLRERELLKGYKVLGKQDMVAGNLDGCDLKRGRPRSKAHLCLLCLFGLV